MNQKTKFLILQLFCSIAALCMYGQTYKSKAALNDVPKNGFYSIDLTPTLSAYLKKDYADFKIVDADNKPVQHIINTTNSSINTNKFLEFPIISYKSDTAKNSILVLKSELPKIGVNAISEIVLFIKNTTVNRAAKISGSNDNKNWFIVENDLFIENQSQTAENYYLHTIKLSKTDYAFYKIEIENKNEDPYNILKAGVSMEQKIQAENNYTKVPNYTITQKDSTNGMSYIKVSNTLPYHIDKLQLYIAGKTLYERNAKLFLTYSDIGRDNTYTNFIVSTKNKNEITVDKINPKEFYFVIDNKDNAALKIDSIICYQKNVAVIANLEQGKKYTLLLQNENAIKPEYDLEKFRDSIPTTVEKIGYGAVSTNLEPTVADKTKNNNWVWISIIIALLVLGFLTRALLRDMKKKNL
jgi:hypothetical protein